MQTISVSPEVADCRWSIADRADLPGRSLHEGSLSNARLDLSAIEIFKTTIEAMSMANFTLNDRPVDIDIDESTPLLWVLRDTLKLNGTKFGCGLAQCGACTVHLDGQAIRSCITPVAAIEGRSVKTIESIGEDKVGSAVQQAWIEHDVPQCGYCQSGQIMSAVALLTRNTAPDDGDIDSAMAGNICRCGTYARIRAAIKSAARRLS